jgi:hypothetical protein
MLAVSTRANTMTIKFHFIVFPLSQELTNYLDRKQANPKKIPCSCQLWTNPRANSIPLIATTPYSPGR